MQKQWLCAICALMLCVCGACGSQTAAPQTPVMPAKLHACLTLRTPQTQLQGEFTFDGDCSRLIVTAPQTLAGVTFVCGEDGGQIESDSPQGTIRAPLPPGSAFCRLHDTLRLPRDGGQITLDEATGLPRMIRLQGNGVASFTSL